MPSVRALASRHLLNLLTVNRAMQALGDEGLLENRRGLGFFVNPGVRARLRAAERQRFLQKEWPQLRGRLRRLEISPEQLNWVSTVMSDQNNPSDHLVEAKSLSIRYGPKRAVDDVSFLIPKGRVVGLLGHNGAGKSTLMRAMVGLAQGSCSLRVLGLNQCKDRVALLQRACYIPDVAILPRWARVDELISLMSGLQPNFSAERARQLLKRTSVGLRDEVKTLSKGMMVQAHLALIAAIDAKLMILDEPRIGNLNALFPCPWHPEHGTHRVCVGLGRGLRTVER